MQGILDGNLTIMAEVIEESADAPSAVPAILNALDAMPLRRGVETLIPPLVNHVLALAGVDPDADATPPKPERAGEAIPFADYFERLFTIATGWLLWPPEAAWNATPAEITAAYKGRLEMLKAIHGGAADDPPPAFDDARDEDGFAQLKFMAASGQNRAA